MDDDETKEIRDEIKKLSESGRRFRINTSNGATANGILLYTISKVLEVNGIMFKFLDKNGKEIICRYDTIRQIEYI